MLQYSQEYHNHKNKEQFEAFLELSENSTEVHLSFSRNFAELEKKLIVLVMLNA